MLALAPLGAHTGSPRHSHWLPSPCRLTGYRSRSPTRWDTSIARSGPCLATAALPDLEDGVTMGGTVHSTGAVGSKATALMTLSVCSAPVFCFFPFVPLCSRSRHRFFSLSLFVRLVCLHARAPSVRYHLHLHAKSLPTPRLQLARPTPTACPNHPAAPHRVSSDWVCSRCIVAAAPNL